MIYSNTEKLQCIRRELKQRRYVYPKRVAAGKMSPQLMNEQISLMEAIEADYEKLAASERLL